METELKRRTGKMPVLRKMQAGCLRYALLALLAFAPQANAANELTLTVTAAFAKSGVTLSKSFTAQFTVTGTSSISAVQNIGTTDETLTLGDVATPGYLVIKNRDTTNYVLLGGDGTNYFDRLKAGEFMVKRWNGSAIHLKANTAACDVEYLLIPD